MLLFFQLEIALRDDAPFNPRSSARNAFVLVTIIRNDNSPVFADAPCVGSIPRGSQVNSIITQVTATDADSGVIDL